MIDMTSDIYPPSLLSRLRLISTDGCHLCHAALAILEEAIQYLPQEIDVIDLDDGQYDIFETLIPVLVLISEDERHHAQTQIDYARYLQSPSHTALCWPFDTKDIHRLLRNNL